MKLSKDLFFNYISLVIMATAGLLMNVLIAGFYDASVLGVFNETYAWYMILSQISVWGIHMAILKYIPEQEVPKNKESILWTSVLVTMMTAGATVGFSEAVLFMVKASAWKKSLQIALTGLFFFSLNKVFLSYLNAVYKMTSYAVFQTLRYLTLIAVIFVIAVKGRDSNLLALSFPVTEGITFFILFVYIRLYLGTAIDFRWKYARGLFSFGTKILPSNMVTEMNTKVDVICLGFLLNDTARIGVYSFSVLFTEGFYMLYMTIRKLINPGIAEANVRGMLDDYISSVQRILKKYVGPGAVLAYSFILCVYFIICRVMLSAEYQIGLLFIAVICSAIMINGTKIIFGDVLSQTGYPLDESKINIVTVLSNTLFNIGLICLLGAIGAAVATGLSHFIYGRCLQRAITKKNGLRI